MKFFRILLLSFLASLPPMLGAQPTAPADVWRLLPQAQVDGQGVYLDQVVQSLNGTRVLPHIRLARAPQPGQASSFSRNEIAGIAEACVPGLVSINWTGAETVRVSRKTRLLEDSDIVDLLTTTMQKEYVKNMGELELHLARPWAGPQAPDEPLTVKITGMPSAGVRPTFIVSFELWDGKEHIGNYQAALQASVWRDVPVAHSTLLRGQLLKDADVTMERSDILLLRDGFMNFPTLDDTLELNETVPAGRPILNRSVRTRPVVLRGQMVEAVYQNGTLGISLMVETLEDGSLGQTVRVRNPKTRRELYGKVVNEKTVSIIL
jgi:flagella basal body P-ring formation protein FlgA